MAFRLWTAVAIIVFHGTTLTFATTTTAEGVTATTTEGVPEVDPNGCTYHQYASCHEQATCVDVDVDNHVWECRCPEELDGDGLKGENNTGCGPKKCRFTQDCHTHANCTELATCECFSGYLGDGWLECVDLDECQESPCHHHANCENTEGSFTCTCQELQNWVGDGFNCTHTCDMDYDCGQNEKCVASVCVCEEGYELQEHACVDVDECVVSNPCDENANCTNTDGSFVCTCRNGYRGNGEVCEALPRNCHEIKVAMPGAGSGEYEIDADGEGPLITITVTCQMRPGLGITIVEPKRTGSTWFTESVPDFQYEYTEFLEDIKAVINGSGYCYQDMSYKCSDGARLMDGDDFWINGNGEKEENWGGAHIHQMCACGQLGYCKQKTSNCNCDGTAGTFYDDGKIIDKSKLPILSVTSHPGGNGKGIVKIGSVLCAPKPFDIPENCHDAKFNTLYKIEKDGPQVLDFDGPDGALDPLLAHCDMETWKHVGVTVIPHTRPYPSDVNNTDDNIIEYMVGTVQIDALVETSVFCSQEASYECNNSPLMNDGQLTGYFKDSDGDIKTYWPGGLGETNMCACGITRTCESDTVKCNCDIQDGVTRRDFGKVTDKTDLPISSVTFTAIGGARSGRYTVGPLMCSNREFGIPATCQEYLNDGAVESHTYLIDPDGPHNPDSNTGILPPFPVYCKITGNPTYAVTVVYHEYREEITVTTAESYGFIYVRVTSEQVEALVERSVTCSQTIKYTCTNAPLHVSGSSPVTWLTPDGREMTYFAGDGRSPVCGCGMTTPSMCSNNGACECDVTDGSTRTDDGTLINKDDLPMMNLTFTQFGASSEAGVEVGPLECKELFPTCADLKLYFNKHRLESEERSEDGYTVVDPDGELGVEPFTVKCVGLKTIIDVVPDPTDETSTKDTDGPVSQCYTVNYMSNGVPVTPEQVQALVESSSFCGQNMKQNCMNAPLTGHTNFTTCDGKPQTGWAGSRGEEKCACGVTGTCAGGPEASCNCDTEDGVMREDGGWMIHKDRLAVCEVCVSLDPASDLDADPKLRRVKPVVSDLFCSSNTVGQGKSCQEWRDDGTTDSGPLMLDPDGAGPFEPIPVHCVLQTYPPFGWTEIVPKEPEIEVPENGTDVTIEYFVYELEMVYKIIEKSRYCTQEMILNCEDSSLELGGQYGWYSRDGVLQESWAGNNEGTPGCVAGECQCNLGGIQVDGGIVTDDDLLPITRIVLGPSTGKRTITIGPVKCFDVYRDCEEIRANNAKRNPLGDDTYAIDPDQEGDVEIFAVTCDFKTDKDIGITVIPVETPDETFVEHRVVPGSYHVNITYEAVTYTQIHALATISGFCHQGVAYSCYQSPLIGDNNPASSYYITYDGQSSSSFGTADHPEVTGCACVVTGTCPPGHGCHCDAVGDMSSNGIDYGTELDRNRLPIEQVRFGGQTDQDAGARFSITDLRCAPNPFDLPKDCQDVRDRGLKSGEHLIWPSTEVDPFLVYCDMTIVPHGGVTIIIHDIPVDGVPVMFNVTQKVTYNNVTDEQLEALTKVSAYCFQPFKYECQNTKMVSDEGYFYWTQTGGVVHQKSVGSGRYYMNECNCGRDGYCGGNETKDILSTMNRRCNCDANDDQLRADAGVFNSTTRLPVGDLSFVHPGTEGAYGYLVLGKLFCSQLDYDINECTTGFNDCHEHARCINTHGSYECECRTGWRGKGRDDVWANGRNCYDDDECAVGLCPWSADCLNLPGSFTCTCREGFNQTGPRTCKDIDECALGLHNCHENARCLNLVGSYDCRCNRNYRGDGFDCKPLAVCACFGDPHCITSDGRLVDYQGSCQYVMSRDQCDDLSAKPTFEILTSFTDRNVRPAIGKATWVKEVTFNIYDYSVLLMQGNEVRINGYTVNMPYRRPDINIRRFGAYTEVYTDIGVEVRWDGVEAVELYTPGQFADTVCGLCGNYNNDPSDDYTVGPGCPALDGQTTNSSTTFGDSWVVPAYADAHPECVVNCSQPEEPGLCEGDALIRAEMMCNKIWNNHAKFQTCLAEIDEEIEQIYWYSCLYDICRVEGDVSLVVCSAAENLVASCKQQYGVEMDTFRSNGFCDVTCTEKMEYSTCGPSVEETCLDVRTNSTPSSEGSGTCIEGCFCKEGYVMDGDKCVARENCGCVYNDNYYSIGDEVSELGCGSKSVCQVGGNMSHVDLKCHENATCFLKDGKYGCHCNEGLYGDGVTVCREDPCEPNPCGGNETCVRKLENVLGYECQCSMGFIGDCGNCTDIDECATGTHECPPLSFCKNAPGTYSCECEDGLEMFDGKCDDINECAVQKVTGVSVCGNNSRCTNRHPGFECPCCDGYVKNSQGDCVESGSASSTEGPQCCVCDIAVCDRPGKVCGEDGVTYNSMRDMIISHCEQGLSYNQQVNVDYFGKCRGGCSTVACPTYQHCVIHEPTGRPTCVCDPCTETEAQSSTVCSDHKVEYPNMCVFKQIMCRHNLEHVPLDDTSACQGKGGGSPVGPWGGWGPCSVTCGKGQKSRSRQAFKSDLDPEQYPVEQSTECYEEACPDGPCVGVNCGVAGHCVPSADGMPDCECPACANIGMEPVCGYAVGTLGGTHPDTWKSECHLRKFVCKHRLEDYEVMYPGHCATEPLNCTRVPNEHIIYGADDSEFVSAEPVNTFECEGGCGHQKDHCCQPAETDVIAVQVFKAGAESAIQEVHVIKSCECVEKVEPPLEVIH